MATRLHAEYVDSLNGDLLAAVRSEDQRAVLTLLDTNMPSSLVNAAVQVAAELNNVELLQLLLDQADVNGPGSDGFTALHRAAQGNCVEALKLLLEKGANVNVEASCKNLRRKGATPVYLASMNDSADTLTHLIAHGADVDKQLTNGASPLFVAEYSH